jgi:uncharacterized membrane protein
MQKVNFCVVVHFLNQNNIILLRFIDSQYSAREKSMAKIGIAHWMLPLLKTKAKTMHTSGAEIFLVLILLTFGVPMVLLIPPGAGYDEEDHLVRVWELSSLSFIPGQIPAKEMKYPKIFREIAYRHSAVNGIVDPQFWRTYAGVPLNEHGYVSNEINTKSVYSPALLLPQAVVMRFLGNKADLPALLVFYVCRLASLISYLVLVWPALRLIPFGKWILLALAASPMALFQAATISADAISNGIGFLFIAGTLRMAGFEKIDWKEVGTLVLLVFLLFLAKLNLIPLILLPFLIIPPSRFTKKDTYALLFAIVVILFAVEVAGWNIVASRPADSVWANEADPGAQLRLILSHPFSFLQIIAFDLLTNGYIYFQGWINGYGYYYWTAPQIVSLFFLLSLGFALYINSIPHWVNRRVIIVFIVIFALGYLSTILSLYVSFTPVGGNKVLGVQGRYFIPLVLLFLLAISGLWDAKNITLISPSWIMGLLTFALSLNVLGILLSFYVPCGTTFYQTGLCYHPLFKDFTPESHISRPVSGELSLSQEIQVSCSGFSELRLLLFPSISTNTYTTRFVLQDSVNDKILVDKSITNNSITAETWYRLRFDPDWQSAGRLYSLEVLSDNTPGDQGLKFLYSPQAEFDSGNLYENGQLVQDNIVLQYGCVTGLRKIWLTANDNKTDTNKLWMADAE